MRNLAEPGARFRAAAPNHPGALLEEPQAFQAVGEKTSKNKSFLSNTFEPPGKKDDHVVKQRWHIMDFVEIITTRNWIPQKQLKYSCCCC